MKRLIALLEEIRMCRLYNGFQTMQSIELIGGLEKKNKLISPDEEEIVAYHEAASRSSWMVLWSMTIWSK